MLSSYLFKTNSKIDEKFNVKGIQNNGIWNHTAGYKMDTKWTFYIQSLKRIFKTWLLSISCVIF